MTMRWGIVSAAKISHDFVNSINSFPGKGHQAVVAIAARDRSRAEAFAKLHKIPNVFNSYQEMAESSDVVGKIMLQRNKDVVYIGVLNPDHFAVTKLFLEHGKHVLCEKPLCLNRKQVLALTKIAKQQKLFLMEAMWSRFSPAYLTLENDIKEGKLGDVKRMEVNFGLPLTSVERLVKKELGGGACLDIGVYALQLAQFIFKDEPTKITVVGELNANGVDTGETIILEYPGGRRAVLNIDITIKLWNRATVYGTKGRATLDEPFNFPERLVRADGCVAMYRLHNSKIPYKFGTTSAGHVYQTLEVMRCLRAGLLESPQMSHRESLILAKLEDTVREQLGVRFDADDENY